MPKGQVAWPAKGAKGGGGQKGGAPSLASIPDNCFFCGHDVDKEGSTHILATCSVCGT